jgi:hypothetical protein
VTEAHSTAAAEAIALRARTRRKRRLRLLGTVLIVYGLAGMLLFAGLALAVERPLDQARDLSQSIEGQRRDVLSSLESASLTIDEMSVAVRGIDTSLSQARQATDRAALLSRSLAASMFSLRTAMGITILGTQPLIGLAAGFDQAGAQLELLADDVAAIGEALEANRDNTQTVAEAMDRLQLSVEGLTEGVREGPRLELSAGTLDDIRLGVYALIAWLLALAVGCVLAGIGCWLAAWRS